MADPRYLKPGTVPASMTAPSPALTREALADILMDLRVDWPHAGVVTYQESMRKLADAILRALGTPPPAPTSTREENL